MAHGDEESLVILDDVSARASHAGRRLGLLLSTIVGRERRLSVTRGVLEEEGQSAHGVRTAVECAAMCSSNYLAS